MDVAFDDLQWIGSPYNLIGLTLLVVLSPIFINCLKDVRRRRRVRKTSSTSQEPKAAKLPHEAGESTVPRTDEPFFQRSTYQTTSSRRKEHSNRSELTKKKVQSKADRQRSPPRLSLQEEPTQSDRSNRDGSLKKWFGSMRGKINPHQSIREEKTQEETSRCARATPNREFDSDRGRLDRSYAKSYTAMSSPTGFDSKRLKQLNALSMRLYDGELCSTMSSDAESVRPNRNPRRKLPADQTYGGAISFWDIAKRTLPLHAFEPLSVLQAVCEELRFAGRFLNNLHEVKEADKRMLQVVGFIISAYTGLPGRNRKPFNPLRGETYDFVHEDGWRYHAEQISNHPPISASYARCPNKWEWFQTLHTKFAPTMDTASMQSLLPVHLKLANGDEYKWYKVTVTICNVRAEAEKRRIKNKGKMIITSNTGIEAEINFMDDDDNTVKGEIRSKDGKVLHRLVGAWDKALYRLLPDGKQEAIFVAPKPSEQAARQYGFNDFTVQLNELKLSQRSTLPPTDSRFRPDIRFLELGDVKKAEAAKKELEQSQRSRATLVHRPMWFTQTQDPNTAQKLWLTNQHYWNSKLAGFQDTYSRQIIQLFPTDSVHE